MPSRIRALYDSFLRNPPRQSRSRSVVEAILHAALERLTRTGNEEDLTLQDIAARAGVGIGSLYDYFGDRRSIVEAVAAKLLDDNQKRLEAALAQTQTLPLDRAIEHVVDHTLDIYLSNKRFSRTIMKVTCSIDLMHVFAESLEKFAATLADALRKRDDITAADIDIDLAAWTVTQSVMGIVHTLVWLEHDAHRVAVVRADAIKLIRRHLLAD